MMDLEDVQAFEERGFNAWPTRRSVSVGGWLCRLGGGYTNRANSINARAVHPSFAGVLPFAERLYGEHGLPSVFRLSPLAPPDADGILEQAGYVLVSPTLVLTAPLIGKLVSSNVLTENMPSEDWLSGFARLTGLAARHAAAHARIVRSITRPKAFATVSREGADEGYGLAVLERGAVGLSDLVVAEGCRGRGLGSTMIEALASWGAAREAGMSYLQVAEANGDAVRLYERLGFRPAYRYHYRLPPARI